MKLIWRDRPLAECKRVQWLISPAPQNTSQSPPLCTWAYCSPYDISAANLVPESMPVFIGMLAHTALHLSILEMALHDSMCSSPFSCFLLCSPQWHPGLYHGVFGIPSLQRGPRCSLLYIYSFGSRCWPVMKCIPSLTHTFPHRACLTLWNTLINTSRILIV